MPSVHIDIHKSYPVSYPKSPIGEESMCVCSHHCLLLDGLTETADGGADGDRGGGVERVSTTRLGLVAAAAGPDTHSAALHRVLAAEIAEELGVLRNLLLLDHLAEGSTITGAVLADDPCYHE